MVMPTIRPITHKPSAGHSTTMCPLTIRSVISRWPAASPTMAEDPVPNSARRIRSPATGGQLLHRARIHPGDHGIEDGFLSFVDGRQCISDGVRRIGLGALGPGL